MASSSPVSRTMSSLNHIHEDILTDILLRLPSKSLIRFRCVCKSWRDLIGSSSFGRSHLSVAKRSNSYIIAYHHSSIDEPELRQHSLFSNETFEPCLKLIHPLWTKQEFMIYGSSNGLVCISDQVIHQNSCIRIWNPSIGKSRTLPNIETCLPDTLHLITLSFGFHQELNDYKVVRIVHQIKSPSEVEVYTLSTDSWKRIGVTLPWFNSTSRFFGGSAFSNGIVYWLASKGSKYTIVLFDTGSEEFQQVMVPDAISSKCIALPRIQPCKESICLLHYYCQRERRRLIIDFWMMKQQSLEKLHTISSPWEFGEYFYWPLGFSIDNDLVLEGAHRYKDQRGVVIDQMSLYNLESKQFKKTGIKLARIGDKSYFFAYIESLVLLDD